MYLDSVRIQNYRRLKNVHITLSPFVCIIGENNCGKSSTLLSLILFINGPKISNNDFNNPSLPIKIEVKIKNITELDLRRLAEKPREKISAIIKENSLKLIRVYEPNGSSEVYYKGLGPKNEKLDYEKIKKEKKLTGKKGKEIQNFMQTYLKDYSEDFEGVKTQKDVEAVLKTIISKLHPDEIEEKEFSLPIEWKKIKPLLPEPILIPAVKDISDDVKTKESATFGKLISVLLSLIENADVFEDITRSFDTLKNLLNKIKTDEGTIDKRIDEVKNIESILEFYIQENFPNVTLELIIPPPELKKIFSGAEIQIDDGVASPIDYKGDGLKRAVTFALLRTYVELTSNDTVKDDIDTFSPYLFLFEEPELYLHPKAQKILFEALTKISGQHQVIVTTHSPIFFAPDYNGTFIKMKKIDEKDVPYSEAWGININDDLTERDFFKLICFENNNAAFFSDKILLVEGDSDLIFFHHISKILRKNWDFDSENIPIIKIEGKGNIKRYKEFFEFFGIDVHVILDLDVIIKGFDKITTNKVTMELRENLLKKIDKIAEEKSILGSPSKDQVKDMVRSYSWVEKYEKLKELASLCITGYYLTKKEKIEIELLFSKEIENKRKQILEKYECDLKTKLLTNLRNEKIYVLYRGPVESYYPKGVTGKDKLSKAFNACKLLTEPAKINELCPQFEHEGVLLPEFEIIFKNIFE